MEFTRRIFDSYSSHLSIIHWLSFMCHALTNLLDGTAKWESGAVYVCLLQLPAEKPSWAVSIRRVCLQQSNSLLILDGAILGQPLHPHTYTVQTTKSCINELCNQSTPRYTPLELFLLTIPLSWLPIRLDIGLIHGQSAGSLWSFNQVQKVFRTQ